MLDNPVVIHIQNTGKIGFQRRRLIVIIFPVQFGCSKFGFNFGKFESPFQLRQKEVELGIFLSFTDGFEASDNVARVVLGCHLPTKFRDRKLSCFFGRHCGQHHQSIMVRDFQTAFAKLGQVQIDQRLGQRVVHCRSPGWISAGWVVDKYYGNLLITPQTTQQGLVFQTTVSILSGSGKTLIEDYRWLVNESAIPFLDATTEAISQRREPVVILKQLRKQLTADRARLVYETCQLRRRAARKFRNAAAMFFREKALQQSSGESIANYKARQFSDRAAVADLCCGIGGDLISLSRNKPILGIESGEVEALLARANCQANQIESTVECSLVEEFQLPPESWIHIDPDRRDPDRRAPDVASNYDSSAGSRRTIQLELFSPGPEFLEKLVSSQPAVAIKVAPATTVPLEWAERCHREWIGDRHELKQQVLWFGAFTQSAKGRGAGIVSATCVDGEQSESFSCTESELAAAQSVRPGSRADKVEAFIFDFHPALRASRLHDAFAETHSAFRMCSGNSYFTADEPVDSNFVSNFRVVDTCRAGFKTIKSVLESNDIGRVEVKRRADCGELHSRLEALRLGGTRKGVVLLGNLKSELIAVVAERV